MSLSLSLGPATIVVGGVRYTLPAQALTLADNSLTLIEAAPTGYVQTTVYGTIPVPGTAAIIALVTTLGGNITNVVDVRQISGTDGNNQPPPSSTFSLASYSIVALSEGVAAIKVNLTAVLTAPLDKTFRYVGFTYAFASTGLWHPLIPAVNAPSDTLSFITTLHGLDPDQDYDIGIQAIGLDGTAVPGTPMLLTPTSPSIAASATTTPIGKVFIPKHSPQPADGSPVASGILVTRHLSGASPMDTSAITLDKIPVPSTLAFNANVPNILPFSTDCVLTVTVGASPYPVYFRFDNGTSGSAPKIWLPSAPASPTTLASYGTSGTPIACPSPLNTSLSTDSIFFLAAYKAGSIAGSVQTYAANVLQTTVTNGGPWTVYAQKNADFSPALKESLYADGYTIQFTTAGGTVSFLGGSGGGGQHSGGGRLL
jgi:hypothetical protein